MTSWVTAQSFLDKEISANNCIVSSMATGGRLQKIVFVQSVVSAAQHGYLISPNQILVVLCSAIWRIYQSHIYIQVEDGK